MKAVTDLHCPRRKIPGAERIAFREAIECLMQTESVYGYVDGAKYTSPRRLCEPASLTTPS